MSTDGFGNWSIHKPEVYTIMRYINFFSDIFYTSVGVIKHTYNPTFSFYIKYNISFYLVAIYFIWFSFTRFSAKKISKQNFGIFPYETSNIFILLLEFTQIFAESIYRINRRIDLTARLYVNEYTIKGFDTLSFLLLNFMLHKETRYE